MVEPNKDLQDVLGEDYEAFVEFKAQKDKRAKIQSAKELARGMISEGGKYFDAYSRLDEQLNAIWEKANAEARKEVGITEED